VRKFKTPTLAPQGWATRQKWAPGYPLFTSDIYLVMVLSPALNRTSLEFRRRATSKQLASGGKMGLENFIFFLLGLMVGAVGLFILFKSVVSNWDLIPAKFRGCYKWLRSEWPRIRFVLLFAIAISFTYARHVFEGVWGRGDLVKDWVEPFLVILAILFAIVQYADASHQEKELDDIIKEMSTQYIGTFPANIEEITKTIGETREQLRIIVDYTAYGQFSAPDLFLKYFTTLESVLETKRKVQIISYDEKLIQDELSHQIPDDWPADNTTTENFLAKIPPFCESRMRDQVAQVFSGEPQPLLADFRGTAPVKKTAKDLRTILQKYNSIFSNQLDEPGEGEPRKGTQNLVHFRTRRRSAFFLWLIDDKRAVFAFNNAPRAGRDRGISFQTRDAKLIGELNEYFETEWNGWVQNTKPNA
jgi:hypothetical protein